MAGFIIIGREEAYRLPGCAPDDTCKLEGLKPRRVTIVGLCIRLGAGTDLTPDTVGR